MFYFSLTNRLLSGLTGLSMMSSLFLSYGSHGRYYQFAREPSHVPSQVINIQSV